MISFDEKRHSNKPEYSHNYCIYWCRVWVHSTDVYQEAPPNVKRSTVTCESILCVWFGALNAKAEV